VQFPGLNEKAVAAFYAAKPTAGSHRASGG
jgi:hypothetical protein